ncbi:MAG: dephospho-CoA kinase [Actinomycetota bacterium]|nr:dephospho-CoA kinase [Actinomycetota bacterium]
MNKGMPRTPAKISIAGNIGSGKSSVARRVAEITGWPVVSTGSLFRELATRRGLTVLELNQLAESDPSIDEEVDGHLRRLALTDDPAVIDSRMAWHFVPESFKTYLVVDPMVAVGRVYGAVRADERYASVEEAAREIIARQHVEAERYEQIYSVHVDDWRNYQLVIDTSRADVDTVAGIIVRRLDELAAEDLPMRPVCLLSPWRLLPTAAIDTVGAGPGDTTGSDSVPVAVHDRRIVIVDRHDVVSEALHRHDPLIRCELIAYDDEEVLPGVPVERFARTAVSERDVEDWERLHGFRFDTFA